MSAHVTQFDSQKLVGAPSRCTKKFLPGAMTSNSCRANYVESSQFCCASASGENNAPSFATQQKLVLDTVDATVGHVTGVHKACVIVSGSMVSKPFMNALRCRLQLKEEGYMAGDVTIGLHLPTQLHRTASFFFLTSLHRSPCTIRSRVSSMYDTISRLFHVRYDLSSLSCTISISEPPLLRYSVLGEYRSPST